MKRKRISWILAGTFLFGVLLFCSLTAERFFAAPPSITDDGARKIMIANIREDGGIFLHLPGMDWSPDAEYLPGGFHFQRTARGIVSFHAPYFAFLAAFLPPLGCGYAGCGLAVLAVFLLMRLLPLRKMRVPAGIGVAVSALTFYGPLCWEMALAGAWGGLAVFWFLDAVKKRDVWRFAAAGAAMGAGLFLREEFYVLGMVSAWILLEAETLRSRRFSAFVLGGLAAAGLYWACNGLLFGNLLGIHGANYHRHAEQAFSLFSHLGNYWVFLFRFDPMPGLGALLLLLAVLGAAKDYRSFRRVRMLLILAASLLWIAAGIRICVKGTPADFLYSISLAGANPLFVFFLGTWRAQWHSPHPLLRMTARISILYSLLTPALLSQSDMGIVWGSRHFFVLFPALTCLSCCGAKRLFLRAWSRRGAIAMVLLASAVLLGAGIFQRNLLMQTSSRLASALERTRGPVVTDLFFLPEITPFQALKRPFFSPHREGDLLRLGRFLKARKMEECVLVLSPRYRKISNRELRLFLQEYEAMKPEKVCTPRVPMLDCWVMPCRAGGPLPDGPSAGRR